MSLPKWYVNKCFSFRKKWKYLPEATSAEVHTRFGVNRKWSSYPMDRVEESQTDCVTRGDMVSDSEHPINEANHGISIHNAPGDSERYRGHSEVSCEESTSPHPEYKLGVKRKSSSNFSYHMDRVEEGQTDCETQGDVVSDSEHPTSEADHGISLENSPGDNEVYRSDSEESTSTRPEVKLGVKRKWSSYPMDRVEEGQTDCETQGDVVSDSEHPTSETDHGISPQNSPGDSDVYRSDSEVYREESTSPRPEVRQSYAALVTTNTDVKCDSGVTTVSSEGSTQQGDLNTDSHIHNGDEGENNGMNQLECTVCGRTNFRWKSQLINHLSTHTDEEPFECSVCGKRFSRMPYLTKHLNTHTGVKPFECTFCGKCFGRKDVLARHLHVHTVDKPFECMVCGKLFSLEAQLASHFLLHSAEKPFECTVCGKSFHQRGNLNRHLRVHTGEKPFECTVCGKQFSLQSHLTRHNLTHTISDTENHINEADQGISIHNFPSASEVCREESTSPRPEVKQSYAALITTNTDVQCDSGVTTVSSEGSTQQGDLNTDIHIHNGDEGENNETNQFESTVRWKGEITNHRSTDTDENPLECFLCGKRFSRMPYLAKHLKTHTGLKPFECSVCGKCFNRKDALDRHLYVHTEDKPFECTVCGKQFSLEAQLTGHRLIHSGEKPFECTVCGKSFLQRGNLNRHTRIHTGEKPYECTECGKQFSMQSHLNRHNLVHTRKKPYECAECGKTFNQKAILCRHLLIHTVEKPLFCQECGKQFIRQGHLNRHLLLQHSGDKPL